MSKGGKTVEFKVPVHKQADAANAWVANREAEPVGQREGVGTLHLRAVDVPAEKPAAGKEKAARLTIDIPESVHRRVKTQCAARGVKMADVVRVFLDREFPEA